MRPDRPDIAAPEFPGRVRWINAGCPPAMAEACASGPVLVHFFDFAQLNSVRALPYAVAWGARYRDAGLTTLGVHSPRFPFSADPATLAEGLERLGVTHPVAADVNYDIWHDYGCKGWPSLFLWGQGGVLRWFHFGEGEYAATEEEIQAQLRELDSLVSLPAPLEPIRPSDAPGAGVVPPSAEVFPGGGITKPWSPSGSDDALTLEYAAGGLHASVAGSGDLRVALDRGASRTIPVAGPGLVDLAVHSRHESHTMCLEADAGLEVYSVSFSPGVP